MTRPQKFKNRFSNGTGETGQNGANSFRENAQEFLVEGGTPSKTLLENLPVAIYTCDAKGFITQYNIAAAELWGREPKTGEDMWCGSWKIYESDGITPMEFDTCPMAITLKEGRPVTGKEIVIERPDGQKRNVQPYPVPTFDKTGKITGAVNMLLDVTDQKKGEKELAHMAAIVHSSSDPIISKTLNGIITSWNTAAERVFGYTAAEMIGQPLLKLIPEDRLAEEPMILERLKRGERVEHFETKRVTKDGKLLDVSLSISPIKDNDGHIIGASKIARDITAQKAVQEELLESEERLRMASESTQLGTWEYDPVHSTLIWSDECRRIYGAPDELNPSNEFVAGLTHPEDREYVRLEVVKAMDPDTDGKFYIQHRFYRASDRQLRWLRVSGKVYFNGQRQPVRFIGSMIDVTEEKQAEQLIRASEERLRMASESTQLGTWEYYPKEDKMVWSHECKKIYDVPIDFEPTNEFVSERMHVDDRPVLHVEFVKALDPKGDGRFRMDYRFFKGTDKQFRWLRVQGQTYFDSEQRPDRFIGTMLDITEEKLAGQLISESEERLRMAVQATKLGTWEFFPLTGKLTWSEECKQIYALPPNQEVDFKVFDEHIHKNDKDFVDEAIQRSMDPAGDGNYDISYRILRFDNKDERWIRAQGKVFFNSEGKAERFIGTVLDITEQKQSQQALEESEQRSRLAIEAASMGTFNWDLITQEFINSPRLNEIFGFPGQAKMTHKNLIDAIHPDDRPMRDQQVKDSARSGFLSYEARIIWPDQSIHWMKIFGKIVYNELKQPLRMYGTAVDITREKSTMAALEESKASLDIALEAAELGMWEWHVNTDHAVYSDRYLEIMGFEKGSEINHQELTSRIHPEDFPVRAKVLKTAFETGILDLEMRIKPGADNIRWVKARGKVFYDENHTPEKILGTLMDITETKTMLNVFQENEERFRIIANTAPVMIWMSGNDKFDDFFNTNWLKFTGRTIEQESYQGWLENVHPDDVDKCISEYRKSFAEQKEFYTEYRLKRHDGQYRWIAGNSVPRRNADGRFAGFICACTDIDDQKNFNEKIKGSELLLKTISNASPVGLWMTDAKAQNTFVNDTWIKWTGIPFEKQLGTGWLGRVLEEDKEEAKKMFWDRLQKREKYSTEFRIMRADGELRWCLTEGTPYYAIDGEFAGYAGSVTDITDLKKMEERKDDFIKMASHELKTPITSIKGYIQLLLKIYEELNEEKFQASKLTVKSSLHVVSKQVSKLTRLVSELLDLTRIESGKLELHKTGFALSDLVEEAVQDVRHTTSRHEIIAHTHFNGNIYADKDRISQVLVNLLTNAIKYSPDGGNIEVHVEQNDAMASIKVKDHGIGIDKKDQGKIFDRFYRVEGKSEQTYPGFGIGLFICAEIVQRHEGGIFVESTRGMGSVFTVSLPMGKES